MGMFTEAQRHFLDTAVSVGFTILAFSRHAIIVLKSGVIMPVNMKITAFWDRLWGRPEDESSRFL
jgi:hypothetical protein